MNQMLALLQPSDEAKASTIIGPHKCVNVVSSCMEFKQGIQSNPSSQYPSFFKQLLKSHLSGKFYLGLPKKFCDAHLPSHDDSVILIDENEQEYTAKYSFRKHRLCCGWRCFSVAHKLLEGDALIFNLIESCKFRVYIVRAGKLAENDGALGLQAYDVQNCIPISAVKMEDQMDERTRHRESNRARIISNSIINPFGSDIPKGIRYPESIPITHFENLKGFDDFKIQVEGQILDPEIPTNIRIKYYNLCSSQRMFLHGHLIKGISTKLVTVMISETVDISEGIRSTNVGTPPHFLECWEKTLKAFEDLGMVVGFLRERLHRLFHLSHEAQCVSESKRRKIAQADREISDLEATPFNIKALMGNIAAEVKVLKCRNERIGVDFEELAGAPW